MGKFRAGGRAFQPYLVTGKDQGILGGMGSQVGTDMLIEHFSLLLVPSLRPNKYSNEIGSPNMWFLLWRDHYGPSQATNDLVICSQSLGYFVTLVNIHTLEVVIFR